MNQELRNDLLKILTNHPLHFLLKKSYAADLRNKITIFKEMTETRKQVFLSLLTTFGLKHNEHSLGLIDNALTMDILFAEED